MTLVDPRQREALEQAVQWYTLLQSGSAGPQDHLGWQHWLQQTAANQWAWQQIEHLQQRLQGIPASVGCRTLDLASQAQLNTRRKVIKGVALLLGGSALGWASYDQVHNGIWLADYRTRVGQRLPVTLADGGQLLLNTDSAADVRYDAQQRLVRLRQGEVMVTTASDPAGRPFFVQTLHGRVQALGTRFAVRVMQGQTQVEVFEHQVRILPSHGQPLLLQPGQFSRFSAAQVAAAKPLAAEQDAWTQGLLVANEQRLGDFIPELARYRSGWLRCDPAVAALRVSGTFPVDDTDKALRAITSVLPVSIERRTRYWVTVSELNTA
ncbi:FecR domain-containing protein [Pseudomonas sp. ITEM 17296]|uniref:FecR domain-containing protein n=1 Tax=Pseudomonas sp. ITEM 17296 TaxID=2790281 RepID=UPI000C128443|nr:FecR domain-containing protein [Pseudomonas sp. ITEM 17296]ATP50933.1 iron dicitrate transport regulator FecR [Pseudomonas putida]MDE4539008.1 FecR domain-containing protein [Pseudomonas sp. ITEM 17296]